MSDAKKKALDAIEKRFGEIEVRKSDLGSIEHLLRLADLAGQEWRFWRGDDAKFLRKALREIQGVLPKMADQADNIERARRAAGLSQGERFGEFARELLAAVERFKIYSKKSPDPRSWWHWYAQTLAQEVQLIYGRVGRTASFTNATSEDIGLVVDLLGLVGIDLTNPAVHDALNKRGNYF